MHYMDHDIYLDMHIVAGWNLISHKLHYILVVQHILVVNKYADCEDSNGISLAYQVLLMHPLAIVLQSVNKHKQIN